MLEVWDEEEVSVVGCVSVINCARGGEVARLKRNVLP